MKRLNWLILKYEIEMIKLGLLLFICAMVSALAIASVTTLNYISWTIMIISFLLMLLSVPLILSDNIFNNYRKTNNSIEVTNFITRKKQYMSKWYYDYMFNDNDCYVNDWNVKREHFNHWKNNIPENRILSFKEYIKLKLSIRKYNKQQEKLIEIEEFCKYYDLEPKEIHEMELVSFDKLFNK